MQAKTSDYGLIGRMPDIEGNAKRLRDALLITVETIRLLAGENVRLRFDRANARHRRKRKAFTRCIAHYRESKKGSIMDISSLYGSSALDSTAYTNAADQTASRLQDKLNSSDYAKATDDELMDACKQFESYFLEQMFKEMMKTIPESEGTSSSNSQLMDYYKDEMVQQIASDSTEQNSLGLAQMLYEQMKRNYNLE